MQVAMQRTPQHIPRQPSSSCDAATTDVVLAFALSEMQRHFELLYADYGSAVPREPRFAHNPCFVNQCSSYQRFARNGLPSIAELIQRNQLVIGFHGMGNLRALQSICCRGFDISRRRQQGQIYGPGEYFSLVGSSVSHGYAKSGGLWAANWCV